MKKTLVLIVALAVMIQARAQTSSSTLETRAPAQMGEEPAITDAEGKSILKSKKIQHPGQKDGLYLIDEDGVYHYKVNTVSRKDDTVYVRFVSQTAPTITTTDSDGNEYGYEDFYSSSQLVGLEFIYEWQPWKSFGKLGVQFGAGLLMANGKGIFFNAETASEREDPRESFTLFSIPLSAGLIYRFEYMNRQWLAPYIAGGGIYNGLIEYRDDGDLKAVGSPAAYGAGGLMVNLTALNRDLAFTMDREYGFSNLWLTAEYRIIQSFNEDLDVSSDQISVGIGADY